MADEGVNKILMIWLCYSHILVTNCLKEQESEFRMFVEVIFVKHHQEQKQFQINLKAENHQIG